jgi:hypothetical protein
LISNTERHRGVLQHYYRLDDTKKVAMHYLLHPLKLTVHYLAEVVTTVF